MGLWGETPYVDRWGHEDTPALHRAKKLWRQIHELPMSIRTRDQLATSLDDLIRVLRRPEE
jgi:hypothetical protein